MKQRSPWAALAGIVVVLVFVAWNQGWLPLGKPAATPALHLGCSDLHHGCSILINGAQYRVRSAQPLSGAHPVDLTLEGSAIKAATASWQMNGMDMGPNQFKFVHQGEHWVAETALPLCSQGRRDWLLTLQIDDITVLINTVSQ